MLPIRTRNWITPFVALCVAVTAVAGEPASASGSAAGIRMRAELPKSVIRLGEPLVVACSIQNGNPNDAWILPPHRGVLAIGIVGPDGEVSRWSDDRCNAGHSSGAQLRSGGEWLHDAVLHLTRDGAGERRLFLAEPGEYELHVEFRVNGQVGSLSGWLGSASSLVRVLVEPALPGDERILQEAESEPSLWRGLTGCECSRMSCEPPHLERWKSHVADVPGSVFAPWLLRSEAQGARARLARLVSRGQGDEKAARAAREEAVAALQRLAGEHPESPLSAAVPEAVTELHDLVRLPMEERGKDLQGRSGP